MIRRLFIPTVLVCMALAPGAHAQDASDQLANLIKESASSADPMMTFMAGFEGMSDVSLSQADIRRALTNSGMPVEGGLMGDFLGGTNKLQKRGNKLKMERSSSFRQATASGGVEFGKKAEFEVSSGFVGALDGDAHERLKNAEGNYVHLTDVDGVKVSKDGDSFYNLYELYFVNEGGKPVVHLKAGVFFHKEWHRIELGGEQPVEPEVVATAATDALPTEEPNLPSALSQVDETPAPADEPTFVATIVDEADLAAPETTTIENDGMLGALSRTTQQQGPAETVADAPAITQQSEASVVDAARDRPLTDNSPIEEPLSDVPAIAQSEAPAQQGEEPLASLTDKPLAELETPSLSDDPNTIPVVIPEAEEKTRIDTEAAEAKTEFDERGDKLDRIIELLEKQPSQAESRLEARLAQLEEQNERLEQRLIELTEKLENADVARRNREDYARDRREFENDRRYRDDRRDPRYDDRYRDDRRDPRYDDRYRDDRRDPRYDDRYRDDRRARIEDRPEEKKGVFSRLLEKIMDGVKKGLAKRAANEEARNVALRTAVMAGGNPANYGYADWAMRNSLANSSYGNTLGVNNAAAMRPVLTTGPNGTLAYNSIPNAGTGFNTGTGAYYVNGRWTNHPPAGYPVQPTVAPTTPWTTPNYATPVLPNMNLPAQPNYGTPNYGTPVAPITSPNAGGAYMVPIVPGR